jgi:hypothetical protein
MTRTAGLVVQATFVMVAGVLLSAALYSDWFMACCMEKWRTPIGILTLPGVLVATLIGGGVHVGDARAFHARACSGIPSGLALDSVSLQSLVEARC